MTVGRFKTNGMGFSHANNTPFKMKLPYFSIISNVITLDM